MRAELIAELATNHGGSMSRAIRFAEAFANAGADTIKLQYTRYKRLSPHDPQYEWFKKAELQDADFDDLADYIEGVLHKNFLLTVYHPDDVSAVRDLTSLVKVGSGEASSNKLAQAIHAHNFRRIIVSSGIRPIASEYYHDDQLACISRYPHPSGLVPAAFTARVVDGWSDHSVGNDGAMIAVTLGARIIEKHVQMKEQAREPQPWEATVDEFKRLREWADLDPDRFLGRWNHAK